MCSQSVKHPLLAIGPITFPIWANLCCQHAQGPTTPLHAVRLEVRSSMHEHKTINYTYNLIKLIKFTSNATF